MEFSLADAVLRRCEQPRWGCLRHIEHEMWWSALFPAMLRQLSETNVSYLEVKSVMGPAIR